jgi:proto-chlorophyllide reductase subunit
MEPAAVEEISPLVYHLRLDCQGCANWITASGRHEEIESIVTSRVWSNEVKHELERLPPHVEPLIRQELEAYADKHNQRIITMALFWEAKNRGKISWTPVAEARLSNVPASIRAMARVEIERMAIDRGLPEITEALMDEAKIKFLGMRS